MATRTSTSTTSQTGLRAGSIDTRESPMGKVTTTSVEGDYKKFGKLLQATTMTQKVMGVEQKITLSDGRVRQRRRRRRSSRPPPIKALIK